MTVLSRLKSTVGDFWSAVDGFININFTAPPAQTATINVLEEQAVLVAPYQVNLDVAVTGFGIDAGDMSAGEYNPQFHNIEYLWSVEKVGDASYATSTYSAVPDLPTHMKTKGTKYGKRICHVIGIGDVVAGETNTFRFTVTAINLATGDSATSSVFERTIAHPDDFFSAAETFVVRVSSATNHPTTSNSYYSSITAAEEAVTASSLTKARIVIERGQSYGSGVRFPGNATGTAIMFDTWGTGDATISGGTFGAFSLFRDIGANYTSIQIAGIKMSGGDRHLFGFLSPAVDNICITVDDCTSENSQSFFEGFQTISNGWFSVSNCSVTGYSTRSSGEGGGNSLALVGCNIGHDVDQMSDDFEGGGYSIRTTNFDELFYASQCSFFSRRGWYNNEAGVATTQPVIRFGPLTPGVPIVIERCVAESGDVCFNIGNDDGAESVITNTVFERNVVVGIHDARRLVAFNTCGTIRNNMLIRVPNAPVSNSDFELKNFIKAEYRSGSSSDPRVPPLKVYNNTGVSLQGVASGNFVSASGFNLTAANNVAHEPYAGNSAGSFTLSEVYAPKFTGYDATVDGEDPRYVTTGSMSPAFTVGEIVTEATSGFQKTYAGTEIRFRHGTGGEAELLAFEMSVINDNLTDAGVERFTSGRALTGSLGGAGTVGGDMYAGQSHDSTKWAVGLVPYTVTPTHVLAFDGGSGTFTAGNTLTAFGKSATICHVDGTTSGRLWLRDITGTFADNDAITDGTATANADGGQASAGTGALWVPTSAIALESGTWADKPFIRKGFTGQDITASQGAGLIDA